MRALRLLIVLSLVGEVAHAQPPVDEDELPPGAIARLGSRQRRWRDTFAHAFVDEGRTLVTVHAGPVLLYRDLKSGRLIRTQQLDDYTPGAAALSTDGRVLAVAHGGTLEMWDVPGKKRLRDFAVNANDTVPYLVRLTADGT